MEILSSLYKEYAGREPDRILPLTASGSRRRYYRIGCGTAPSPRTVIGVIGTDRRENMAFMALASHFRSKGINVPEVLAASADGMCYLQEDLGDRSLFDAVSRGRESGNYSPEEKSLLLMTVATLPQIQFLGAEGLDFSVCHPEPAFGERLVMSDLNYFKYCFLKTLPLDFNEVELERDFRAFAADLLEGDCDAFMYRDFQARNVMLRDGRPWFIDFQGGMRGPAQYDLASFVWQARANYPEDFRDELVEAYLGAAENFARIDRGLFLGRLRLFVLFRTLQVLGAYGFRGKFERKPHFLRSIPFAVENLRRLLDDPPAEYPYLIPLLRDMTQLPEFQSGDSVPGQADGTARPVAASLSPSAASLSPLAAVSPRAGAEDAVTEPVAAPLEVLVCSFSYRKPLPEDPSGNGGGYVFDCRALPNPGKYEQYRTLTGMDREVQAFLENRTQVETFLESVSRLTDAHVRRFKERGFTHLMICFGCTGGQHRSVYCAERTAARLASCPGVKVTLIHREQGVRRELMGGAR